LGVGGVGAVQNTLKYRSINEYKLWRKRAAHVR
jgi:hypothetical protein